MLRSRVGIFVPMRVAVLCVVLQACGQQSADKTRDAGRGIPGAALSQFQLKQSELQGIPATFKSEEGFSFVLIPGGDFYMAVRQRRLDMMGPRGSTT